MHLPKIARRATSLVCLLATTLAACGGGSHRATAAAPSSGAQQPAAPPTHATVNASGATAPMTATSPTAKPAWLREPQIVQGTLSRSDAQGLPTGQRSDLVFQISKKPGHEGPWVMGLWKVSPHQTLTFSGPAEREGTYPLIDASNQRHGEITLNLPRKCDTGAARAVIFGDRAGWHGVLAHPERAAELPRNATFQITRLLVAELPPYLAPESDEPLGRQLFVKKLERSVWVLTNSRPSPLRITATLNALNRPDEYAAHITIEPTDAIGNQMVQIHRADGLCRVTVGADGSLALTLLSTKPRARLWLEATP